MKTCFKCQRVLALSEFYRHPMMADGHLGKCKDCAREDVRQNYAARRDQYREYDHRRYVEGGVRGDPVRIAARVAARKAVYRGELERGPCEFAGEDCRGRIEGHHEDYSRPLDVRWLCQKHHMQLHRRQEESAA